jgi:hypothetical protein
MSSKLITIKQVEISSSSLPFFLPLPQNLHCSFENEETLLLGLEAFNVFCPDLTPFSFCFLYQTGLKTTVGKSVSDYKSRNNDASAL